jgi:uncharacterized protein YbaR (Trm112 family)
MGFTLEEFASKHKLKIGTMHIDNVVSHNERDIQLLTCPECGKFLFLYHKKEKADPFILAKVLFGILKDKKIKDTKWVVTCWTEDCGFHLIVPKKDIVKCPECKRFFLDYYSLYDHMRYQCTQNARLSERIRGAGAGMYVKDMLLPP